MMMVGGRWPKRSKGNNSGLLRLTVACFKQIITPPGREHPQGSRQALDNKVLMVVRDCCVCKGKKQSDNKISAWDHKIVVSFISSESKL